MSLLADDGEKPSGESQDSTDKGRRHKRETREAEARSQEKMRRSGRFHRPWPADLDAAIRCSIPVFGTSPERHPEYRRLESIAVRKNSPARNRHCKKTIIIAVRQSFVATPVYRSEERRV